VEPQTAVSRKVIVRDLAIFQIKLIFDGLKDLVLVQLSIGAAVMDLVLGGRRRGRFLYSVMRLSERFDLWLNLNGAVEAARRSPDGLMASTPRGADSIVAKTEDLVELGVLSAKHWHRARKASRGAAAGAAGGNA